MLATSVARGAFSEQPKRRNNPMPLQVCCGPALSPAFTPRPWLRHLKAALPLHKSNDFFGHHRSQPPVRVERLVLTLRPRLQGLLLDGLLEPLVLQVLQLALAVEAHTALTPRADGALLVL